MTCLIFETPEQGAYFIVLIVQFSVLWQLLSVLSPLVGRATNWLQKTGSRWPLFLYFLHGLALC